MFAWRRLAAGGLAATLGWVYWTALLAPAVGAFHDDGIYAITAKSLATGHGYRIVSLPDELVQTKYPFLFPALLAAVWRVFPRFPDNVVWLKLVPFACAVVWGLLGYRWLRDQTRSAPISLALAGFLAISPWVLFLSTTLLSEMLFAAFMMGALVLLGRCERGTYGWKGVVGAAILASGAFLTRTAGVAVIAAGGLVLLRAAWRRAMAFLVISAALCAPWICWQARQRPAPMASEAYYSLANYGDWNIIFHFTLGEKTRILGENLLGVLLSTAVLMGVPATGWGAVLALAAGLLVAAGFVGRLRLHPNAAEILVALYGGLVVFWAWPPMRFMAPLLPVLLLYGYEGALAFCRALHFDRRRTWAALASLAILITLPSVWTLAAVAGDARDTGAVTVPNTPHDDWREMAQLMTWIDRNTPGNAVLMGNLDPALYLYTGRKSVRGFVPEPYRLHYGGGAGDQPLGSVPDMMRAIRRYHATYLVWTPNLAFREGQYLDELTMELVRDRPAAFRLAYQSHDARYRVYRVALVDFPSGLSGPPDFRPHPKLLASN